MVAGTMQAIIPQVSATTVQPTATLNPPPGITPAQTREPFPWSFPRYTSPDPQAPGRYPRMTWTPEERKKMEEARKRLEELMRQQGEFNKIKDLITVR